MRVGGTTIDLDATRTDDETHVEIHPLPDDAELEVTVE